MACLYGLVHLPGTKDELIIFNSQVAWQADKENMNIILRKEWNPEDVWFFDESQGILFGYKTKGSVTSPEKLKELREFVENWNKRYKNGGTDTYTGPYSEHSSIYVNWYHEDGPKSYCICMSDFHHRYYGVPCMSFLNIEIEAYWKKRKIKEPKLEYASARSEFFNERCKHHKSH